MPDTKTITDPSHPGIQLMNALMDDINKANVQHGTVLDVLLALYGQVVLQFPCCHDFALDGMGRLAEKVRKARALQHYTEQASLAAIERAAHGADPRSTH